MEIKRAQRNQDLSWFLDMYESEKLILDPPYQRKSVWGPKDRKFFLDTIFNNFPCPAIYLQKEITDRSMVYNVVDGKQRLLTIIDFFNNKLRIAKDFPDARLANKLWKDIEVDQEFRYKFFNYSFSVEQLQCEGEVQWDEIFNRVNKNQKTLNAQELRHARFNGWLISKAEAEAGSSYWKQLKVSTRGRAKRMGDAEFISILMLVILENDFVGFPQTNIDKLYVKYDFKEEELIEAEEVENDESSEFNTITQDIVDDFEEAYDNTKKTIKGIINSNDELIKFISKKPLTHIYTLWSVIAFNLDAGIDEQHVADRFCELLERCEGFKDPDFKIENLPQDDESSAAYRYFQRTTGAATEKQPRLERHEALTDFLGWR